MSRVLSCLDINYRCAVMDDIAFLKRLRLEAMGPILKKVGFAMDDAAIKSRVLFEFEYASIIELNQEPVGCFNFKRSGNVCLLLQLQILPSFQNLGIGRQILKFCAKKAKDMPIYLSVIKGNPAQKLYSRFGFKLSNEKILNISEQELLMKFCHRS